MVYHTRKKQPIGTSLELVAICTDELRKEFDAQSFTGLTFRNVIIKSRKPVNVAYWQFWSDRRMPPLLNRIVNEDGTDYDPSECNGCRVQDDFWPPLMRFPERKVRDMGQFDAALTLEAFGAGPHQPVNGPKWRGEWIYMLDPWLIVSRRFRDWCLKRKLKIEWIPVVLE